MTRAFTIAAWLLSVSASMSADAASAVELEGGAVEIQIDQRMAPGQWIVRDTTDSNGGAQTGRLGDRLTVRLPPARTARVTVANSIPVLFEYSLSVGEPVETESFKAALSFLNQLTPLQPKAAAATDGSKHLAPFVEAQCAVVYDTVNLCDLPEATKQLLQFEKVANSALAAAVSGNEQAVSGYKSELLALTSKLEELDRKIEQLSDADLRAAVNAGSVTWAIGDAGSKTGTLEDLQREAAARTKSGVAVNTAVALVRRRPGGDHLDRHRFQDEPGDYSATAAFTHHIYIWPLIIERRRRHGLRKEVTDLSYRHAVLPRRRAMCAKGMAVGVR